MKSSLLSGAASPILAALLLCGCVTSKVNTHSTDVSQAYIYGGNIAYTYQDGHVLNESYPQESGLTIKNGSISHASAGIPKELELGWDMFGLKPRPMIMIRTFYIFDFGGAIGADDSEFLFGLDWRYKDILIGPCIGIPYDDPGHTIYGGKLAIPFRW